MTGRRVLVLFADEWDRAAIARRNDGARYHFEGFDLFRFPENARLFTFDVLAFARALAKKYRRIGIDAVVTSEEQFGPIVASLLARELGLPHNPIGAVLTSQHKYYARRAFQDHLPEANAGFGLIPRDFRRRKEAPLPFPFYVKPVKAAFSVLARRVDTWDELDRHARFSWWEQAIIERLVKPFGDVMRAHSRYEVEPFSMLAEEIVDGHQVTVNGFAREGRVTMQGVVDSIMYPGTDQFQRFQYPSRLPFDLQERVEETATKALAAVGFRHGMFNVELRVCPASGHAKLIEINPRAAGQFFDLFERVDGYNAFDALVALEAGEEPRLRRRAGDSAVAASFVMRDLAGEGLSRWPGKGEIDALRGRHPEARLMIYRKRGADLRREIKWLGTYRYAVANLAARSSRELFAAYRRLHDDIDFHPARQDGPSLEQMLGEAPGD
jgi:hypothetical protein